MRRAKVSTSALRISRIESVMQGEFAPKGGFRGIVPDRVENFLRQSARGSAPDGFHFETN
jgi:hypothetical protein